MMSTVASVDSREKIYEWLHVQAAKLGLRISLLTEDAMLLNGWLYLPTRIEGVIDIYDNALKLQQLEDTWNEREPQPELPLLLIPAKDSIRQAAYEKVIQASQRKIKAVEAFGNATSVEEQEKAASEFQEAKRAEDMLNQAYTKIMPWDERVP